MISITEEFPSLSDQHVPSTVKWFNDQKCFGFIEHEGGKDGFVHHSPIVSEGFRSLSGGDRVEFSIEQGRKGPNAGNVRRV